MGQHGNHPTKNIVAIIPARFASTRLPGKMLRLINGKPLILHTLQRASESELVSRAVVATDDRRIFNTVNAAGGEAVMTSKRHRSGSDRIAEAAESLPNDTIVVNVQGDEPLISPETIDRAIQAMINDTAADIVTVAEPIEDLAELQDPNVVKVAANEAGRALYFSRSPIPFPREAALRYGGDSDEALRNEPELLANFKKHCGLYVYRREYLMEFTKMPQTQLETTEMLEQLRALENGAKIVVVEAAARSIGVDTEQDLENVARIIRGEAGLSAAGL